MRGVFIYIILAIQVTSLSQTVTFKFEHYKTCKVGLTNSISFENSFFDENIHPYKQLRLNKKLKKNYSVLSLKSDPCSKEELRHIENWLWTTSPIVKISNGISSGKIYSNIKMYPFFISNGVKHKIKEITLSLNPSYKESTFPFKSQENKKESILSDGEWFKFKVIKSGVYKLSYEELLDLNILRGPIPSNSLAIFSNPSRMLDFTVGNERPQDLIEIPTELKSKSNSTFGPGSELLFFVEANGHEHYDMKDNFFKNEINLYSDTNFVFINTNALYRKKISTQIHSNISDTVFDYTKVIHHEKDLINFIKSGRHWLGESFEINPLIFKTSYTPPIKKNPSLKIKYKVCSRSSTSNNNKISLILQDDTISNCKMGKVSSIYYSDYVKFGENNFETNNFKQVKKDSLNLHFFYHQEGNPSAWLDYFSLNTVERIKSKGAQSIISVSENYNKVSTINVLSSYEKPRAWDISKPSEIYKIPVIKTDTGFTYNTKLDTLRKFILFEETNLESPEFVKKVSNQNLHGLSPSNYLIITQKQFSNQANRLIKLHSTHDNLSGQIGFVEEIYNEFSCGRPEASAIRDFIKTIYEKGKGTADSLCYVLLLGEGSYDPKNRINNNLNIIPTFQSVNSVKLVSSYVTDDFYGLMDDNEGTYLNGDLLDLGIGRIPAKTKEEAKNVIDKIFEYYDAYTKSFEIINYEQKLLTSKGNWKNNILFIADDGDYNEHMKQSHFLANKVSKSIGFLNLKRIFIDAFPKETTTSGKFSPETNRAINSALKEGALIVNYTGHGGELGWADERIFITKDIQSMNNRNRLPLFVTATCEFSRFDCPDRISAGEHLILQPKGGAIGLFTTVRLVFSIPNFNLNKTFYSVLESALKNKKSTIGDIFKNTKVINNGGVNDRNFTLLGDPALKLSLPTKNIILDSITYLGKKIDTIKSISSPTLHGRIVDESNNTISDFNGWIDIQLFDKKQNAQTLANDKNSEPFHYSNQENLLTKGKTLVTNGFFSTNIFIPKDVQQNYDFARLSFYGVDSAIGDASGYDENVLIGGTASNYLKDDEGPSISLYLDDTTFVFGNNVSSAPIFIAALKDSSGINIIPNDIGKDIVLTIDERQDLSFVLNNFYTPSTSTYQKGEVVFPLDQLDEGRHSIEFKAFDNQNNSSKAYTEFIIENNPKLALKHLLNYPNPFTTNTGFYFEHNQTTEELGIIIHIYTISGKIIKTLEGFYSAKSMQIGPIKWDGLDEFGDKIGKGVYVYQITVKNSKGETDKAIQKLVLLR